MLVAGWCKLGIPTFRLNLMTDGARHGLQVAVLGRLHTNASGYKERLLTGCPCWTIDEVEAEYLVRAGLRLGNFYDPQAMRAGRSLQGVGLA